MRASHTTNQKRRGTTIGLCGLSIGSTVAVLSGGVAHAQSPSSSSDCPTGSTLVSTGICETTLSDSSGAWQVPADVTAIDVLLVGGGGGGGTGDIYGAPGGGGGAGQVRVINDIGVTAGDHLNYSVGQGGSQGANGTDTLLTVGTRTDPSVGGSGGQPADNLYGSGGSLGDVCIPTTSGWGDGGSSGIGYPGGAYALAYYMVAFPWGAPYCTNISASGGAGQGGPGIAATQNAGTDGISGSGGPGVSAATASNSTGLFATDSSTYGGGGGGGQGINFNFVSVGCSSSDQAGTATQGGGAGGGGNATPGTGGGGGGGGNCGGQNYGGGSGGSGTIVIRFSAPAPTTTSSSSTTTTRPSPTTSSSSTTAAVLPTTGSGSQGVGLIGLVASALGFGLLWFRRRFARS